MSVELEFNAEELSERIRRGLQAELMALGEELAGRIQRSIRDKGAIASGTLVSTIGPRAVEGGVQVGSPVEYGEYVEFGTRPHWPPYGPIRQWVELKKSQFTTLAIGVSFESGRALPTRRGTIRVPRDKQTRLLDSIARAIQRKIAERGTQGKFYMREAIESLGLSYELEQGEEGSVYHIDVADYLSRTFNVEDL